MSARKQISQTQFQTAQRKQRGEAVLAILTRAASAGAPCPTNDDIADEALLGEASNATSIINDLRDSGVISITSNGGYRFITILATGIATAWTARPKRYVKRVGWVDGVGREQAGSFRGDLPAERYVDRTPCSYCGVRADVGCRHQHSIGVAA